MHGGLPDIIDEGSTGFLVPERDVARLSDRLERLIADPALRRRMGAAGRGSRWNASMTLENASPSWKASATRRF